jgi:Tol biopolymer transport system component
MGVVHKAENSRLHRFVALKLLSNQISNDRVARDRFRRSDLFAFGIVLHEMAAILIEVLPGDGGPSATTALVESRQAIRGFAWTDDGGILYPRGHELVVRAADGRERSVPMSDVNSPCNPSVCRESGQIVFEWPFKNGSTTWNVWRINADGREPHQLTDLPHTHHPQCSPDGQWVVFFAPTGLHRVPASGGPVESLYPTIGIGNLVWSPDSTKVAFVTSVRGADNRGPLRKLVLITPGEPTRLFEMAADAGVTIRFTPDGSGVSYAVREKGTTTIHIQPIDGSAARRTASDQDLSGRLSPDGSTVAIARQRVDSDVVLLRDGEPRRR